MWQHVKIFSHYHYRYKNTHTIFVPDIGALRGKKVKSRNSDVGLCGNPQTDKRKDEEIELTSDVMFVNKILFVISLGKI